MLIGVISDTHGTVPSWIGTAFAGVDLIIHGGDVGRAAVLDELGCIAPVVAVRGNVDTELDVSALPDHRRLELEGVGVLVVHKPEHVRSLVGADDVGVVIVGHTHRARIGSSGHYLILNPGSASRSVGEGHTVALASNRRGSATGGDRPGAASTLSGSAVMRTPAEERVNGAGVSTGPVRSVTMRSKERSVVRISAAGG